MRVSIGWDLSDMGSRCLESFGIDGRRFRIRVPTCPLSVGPHSEVHAIHRGVREIIYNFTRLDDAPPLRLNLLFFNMVELVV